MNHTSFLIEALNELIQINKDRVVGYLQAANEMEGADFFLKEICLEIVKDGKKNIQDLLFEIKKIDIAQPAPIAKNGKIIELWNEAAEAESSNNVKTSFATCVCGEDAVQQMYEDTLLTYAFMPVELRAIVTQQRKKIGAYKKNIMNYLNVGRAIAVA